jgi:hypothetical protein
VKNFDLRRKILDSTGGQQIFESYQRNQTLTEAHRNKVVTVVADFYLENRSNKDGIEFQKLLAAKIKEVFPEESVVSCNEIS